MRLGDAISSKLRRMGRAVDGAESPRLGPLHCLELPACISMAPGLEQCLRQQLARRSKRAGRDGSLLGPALALGSLSQHA